MTDEEKPKCKCKKGLPPWMGTFADLMSLLMCFFVLLLSFSEMDAMKFKRLAGSMAQAFGVQSKLNVHDVPKGTSIIAQEFSPSTPDPTPIEQIFQHTDDYTEMSLEVKCTEEFDIQQGEENVDAGAQVRARQILEKALSDTEQDAFDLAGALHDPISEGLVEIETIGRMIIIRILEQGSFASGSVELTPRYKSLMADVRGLLMAQSGKISIQGHTDNIPYKGGDFRTNWDLSSARAVSVALELMKEGYIPQTRFEVSGYAETKPLMDNDTIANRARNRRVEIIIKQGLEDDIPEEDLEILRDTPEGEDILREINVEPEYLFDLEPEEIF